ncbi:MAG: helix-turn-helix domain-containing protein, partial [Blastocatellia bacterium]
VPPLLRELILHICGIGALNRDVPSHSRLTGIVIDQLDAMHAAPLQLPMPSDPRALRIAETLISDPGDAVSLGVLAQRAGASKRTAERLFRMETGLTFARWRQQLRFLHALRLLAKGDSVTSVALDAGYESTSAFIFAFKKVMGSTPRAYYAGHRSE